MIERFPELVADSTPGEEKLRRAAIESCRGAMIVVLHEGKAPVTVRRFVDLAQCGFYDGLAFHRVVPGFCVQAGRSKDTKLVDRLAPLPD